MVVHRCCHRDAAWFIQNPNQAAKQIAGYIAFSATSSNELISSVLQKVLNPTDFANQVIWSARRIGQPGRRRRSPSQLLALIWCWPTAPRTNCLVSFLEFAGSDRHMFCGMVDATDPVSVQFEVDKALERFGRIDVLANTVGGYRAGTPTHETSLETWDFMFNLNARSAFVMSRAVVPPMLAQGSGRIIHTAARAALAGTANHSAYNAPKSVAARLVEHVNEQ